MSEIEGLGFKLNKKVKLGIGAHKSSKRKPRSGLNDEDVDGKRQFGSKTTSDMRRKRVYGDKDSGKEGKSSNVGVLSLKSLSRKRGSDRDRVRDGDDSRKERLKPGAMRKPRDVSRGRIGKRDEFGEDTSRKKEFKGRVDLTRRVNDRVGSDVSSVRLRMEVKHRNRRVSTKHDDMERGVRKKHPKNEIESTNLVDQKRGVTKKMQRYRKGLEDESEVMEAPKKKKRMRVDPYDDSNKKLDDDISLNGKCEEKKVDLESKNEVSLNAQFRAIQPKPSILAFVEDNFLGRRRSIELKRAGYNIDLSAPLDNIPFSTSDERERIEEIVFKNNLTFFAAAKVSSSFPPADLPEIAFAGRSNVGKSSLLNALTRRWGVVRTSDKPGLTQTINFFNLGSKLSLVDLPGYGFAYAKEEVKDSWEELVKEYVSTRVGLKRVCLLIDTKWGMKLRDYELINLMERSQTKYQIVLTKTDVVFPIDVARRAMQIEETDEYHCSFLILLISFLIEDDGKLQVWCWHPKPENGSRQAYTLRQTVEESAEMVKTRSQSSREATSRRIKQFYDELVLRYFGSVNLNGPPLPPREASYEGMCEAEAALWREDLYLHCQLQTVILHPMARKAALVAQARELVRKEGFVCDVIMKLTCVGLELWLVCDILINYFTYNSQSFLLCVNFSVRSTMEDSVDENWSKVIGEESPKRCENERIVDPFSAEAPYEGQHFDTVEDAHLWHERYGRGQGFSTKIHNSTKRPRSDDIGIRSGLLISEVEAVEKSRWRSGGGGSGEESVLKISGEESVVDFGGRGVENGGRGVENGALVQIYV
ncbi:hypothetical protein GIB67_010989 [Kingdonia uniflora]|uniref:EngB-type G domain-containing protein n=1 Tax=Kingdonia uniflora TaxID=39325 RepID=A0A7J7MM84_9MAGN|nr:hypothetical protein GIB67_010989 [Kingdonia uniflora]